MRKIKNIRKVKLNGQNVKTFDLYEYNQKAYVFAGRYSAPAKTKNKNLWKHID